METLQLILNDGTLLLYIARDILGLYLIIFLMTWNETYGWFYICLIAMFLGFEASWVIESYVRCLRTVGDMDSYTRIMGSFWWGSRLAIPCLTMGLSITIMTLRRCGYLIRKPWNGVDRRGKRD